MRLTKRFIAGLFLLLLASIECLGQKNHQAQSLRSVLQELEARHKITFSYLDENIKDITIDSPAEGFSLKKSLKYLEKNTGLQFRQLNKRFVTITKISVGAGAICGYIIDSETRLAVAGATIASGSGLAVSNENGYFKLGNLSQNDSVTIQFLGYQTTRLQAGPLLNIPCREIYLKEIVKTLQEVIVTNYITSGIDKRIDGAFDINTPRVGLLPGLTESDVLYTIQALPGIQSINETVSDINVRGGTNDQNLVLWDGIRMYQSGHFFGLISAFNPQLTEKVTLIKNGTSAAWGDGVSSTIDIRSDNRLNTQLFAGGGINLINFDAFAKVPLSDKAAIHISGRRSIADLLETPAYDQYFERAFRDTDITGFSNDTDTMIMADENFYFFDTSLKLIYDINEKEKLRLSFLNIFNDIEYQESEFINNVEESRTSGLEQHNLAAGINYSRLWNEKLRTSARWYLSWYELSAINFDIPNNQRLIQENEVLDTGIKLDARLSLTGNIDLFGGYQFFEIGVSNLEDINNPAFRRLIKNVQRSHVFFTEGNYTSDSKATNMRAGVRANYFQKFDELIIEPRIAISHQFLDHLSLEILGEMKSQTTSQVIDFQTDFLGIEKRRWVLSNNDDIPIIKSKQLSTGIHYKQNGLLVSVEGYIKVVEGITSSSQGFQNQFQFVRTSGSYDATGIDFLVNKRFDKITSWLSYSFADNTFDFSTFDPPSFPNNLEINHTITLGATYHNRDLEMSAGLNWHTGRPFTEPVAGNGIVDGEINYRSPNSSQLRNYLRIDLSGKYSFRLSGKLRAQVGASVWNLPDRENIFNTYHQIGEDNQLEVIEQSSLGITPNFLFRINF